MSTVNLLIAHGADVNKETKTGATAVVDLLRSHGAIEGKPLPPCK
jgi:hypothetical protein